MVAHREKPGVLVVRARKAGDIEAVFPGSSTWVDRSADYPHRAEVPSGEVAEAAGARFREINCPKFKPSAREARRHDCYLKVWEAMFRRGQKPRAFGDTGERKRVRR